MRKLIVLILSLTLALPLFAGCGSKSVIDKSATPMPTSVSPDASSAPSAEPTPTSSPSPSPSASAPPGKDPGTADESKGDLQVVAEPDSITVLVNKHLALPQDFAPKDLVYPDVPFTFKQKLEKRKLRKVAADALEKMFSAAKQDGVNLAGVSGYRSYATQKILFENYVKKDGYEKARTYSALPGTSEHETGLAIDVSGTDGKCAASDCFRGSKEADWLAKHASQYGFIIRYPMDKEAITGYEYEPWHLRYVGLKAAKEISDKSETLEEYLHAIPVSN